MSLTVREQQVYDALRQFGAPMPLSTLALTVFGAADYRDLNATRVWVCRLRAKGVPVTDGRKAGGLYQLVEASQQR